MNSESIDDIKLRMKKHYDAVLNQAPSDNLAKVSSESSSLINIYNYSFTIPDIRTAMKISRTNTAPGSDGMPNRVFHLCHLKDVLNVLNSHSNLVAIATLSLTNGNIAL